MHRNASDIAHLGTALYTDLASMTKPPRVCPRSQPLPPAVVPRLTSQVQFLAPRLKGKVLYDPEPGPFR
jgi:hypothetical protein